MANSPNPEEIKEFQFKLHSRLRIFNNAVSPFQKNVNILTGASRYGLLFAGIPSGFRVIDIASVQVSGSTEQREYVHRNVDLPSQPSFLSVNADQTLFAAIIEIDGCSAAFIYDLHSLATQHVAVKYQIRLTQEPNSSVLDLQWNPAIPNLLSFVFSDGSVFVYEFKGGPYSFNSLPPTSQASCHSWSPKGKQIVIGAANGSMTQFKPDLKAVKTIGPPPYIQNPFVVNIHWLSSFQFCVVYKNAADLDGRPSIIIVNTPKNEPVQYINYEDICFSMGTMRPPQYYIIHQQTWNILLVSSANSTEVGVLAAGAKNWIPWTQIDEGRAELPTDPSTRNETYPVGFTLDVSSTQPIPWGTENQVIPPMPILAVLSHTGVLCLFHVVNLLPTFVQVCSPPEPLADKSALQFMAVMSQEPVKTLPATPQQTINQITPEKQTAPANESLNFQNGAPFTPQQSQPFSFSTPNKPNMDNAQKKLDFSFSQNTSTTAPGLMKPPEMSSGMTMFGKTPTSSAPLFGSPATATPFKPPASFTPSVAPSLPSPTVAQNSYVPAIKIPTPAPSTLATTPAPNSAPVQPRTVSTPVKSAAEIEAEKERNAEAVKTANNAMYISAVNDEVTQFESELKDFKKTVVSLNITVGSEEEKNALKKSVDGLENFYKELKETTSSLNLEVESLKTILMETFSWIEDARARETQLRHPGYQNVVRSQELDPVSLRRLNSIQSSVYYVESQLQQANIHLDSTWADLQESYVQNKDKMRIPRMEVVYQAMVSQKNVFNKLHSLIDGLSSKVKVLQNDKPFIMTSRLSESVNGDSELSKLAETLIKVKLNQSEKLGNPCLEAKKHLILLAKKQILSAAKEAKLKELQSLHTPKRIKPARLKMTNGALFGSCNVLPLPPPGEISADTSIPNKLSSISSRIMTNAESLPSPSEQLPPESPPVTNAKVSIPKTNLQNSVVVDKPVVQNEKTDSAPAANFNFGKTDAVSAKTVSSSSTPSSFAFQSSATSTATPTVSAFSFANKAFPGISVSAVGGTEARPDTKFTFSMSGESKKQESKNVEVKFTAPSSPAMSNLFGAGEGSKNIAPSFSSPQVSKSNDFAAGKENSPKSTAADLNFGSLGFGSNVETSGKPAAVSIFGGSTAAKISPLSSKPAVDPALPDEVSGTRSPSPNSVVLAAGFAAGSLPSSSFGTSTADSSPLNLQVNLNKRTEGNDVAKSDSSPPSEKWGNWASSTPVLALGGLSTATTAASFSFGGTTKGVAASNAAASSLQAPKSGLASSGWNFTAVTVSGAAAVSTAETTTSAPTAFSFGSLTKAVSTISSTPTSSSLQFSATGLSTSSSSTPATTTAQSPVFSFSSAQTAVTSGQLPAVSDAKPTFSFGQALATSNAQSPFSTFSFGNSKSQVSIFGGQCKPSETPISTATTTDSSSAPESSSASVEAAAATNLFGSLSVTTTSSSGLFGNIPAATTTTATGNIFSSPSVATTASSIFGSSSLPTVGPSLFGAPPATTAATSGLFGTSTTTSAPSLFGSPPAVTTATGTSVFAQAAAQVATGSPQPGLFANAVQATTTASSPSIFGGSATAPANTSVFGLATTSATTSKPGLFGSSSPSLFGAPVSKPSSTNLFGSPNPATTAATNSSLFGSPTTTASASNSSFFGQAICSPTPTTNSVFGQSPQPVFGQTTAAGTPSFGSPPMFGAKTTFGQSGGSLFGNSGSSFGQSSGTSVFGQPSQAPALGGAGATSTVFGQSPGANPSGSIFGGANTSGGSFSGGLNQSVAQAGFGTPPSFQNKAASGFGSPPAFGSQPAFGSAPAFGAPPAFGSPPSVFGSASPTNAFGGGMGNQSSPTNSTFENLAKQNTVSFGNLAQNQTTPGFGNANLFGGSPQNANTFQQQQQQQQQQKPANPQFGGSSFTSWR